MRLTSLLLALLLAGGLYYWFALRGPAENVAAIASTESTQHESTQYAPVPVMVLDSQARETADELLLRGRTVAVRNVSVPAETDGLVISEPLRKGTTVERGNIMCRLDSGARHAQLLEAQARLAEAHIEKTAATELSKKGYVAKTTLKAREAQLEAAQAAVDLVELDIDRLDIRAPFDGVLETDSAEIGSRLAPGDTCATVIDLSSVKVSGYVSEQEVDKIEIGQSATGRLANEREIEGRISFISRVSDPATQTFQVEVTLPNEDGQIRDGMTAELTIKLPAVTAHCIPQAALTLNDDGRLGVRLAAGGVAHFVEADTVRYQSDGVWVTGLPEAANVIVVGQEFVRDGRAIAATADDSRSACN